MVVQRIRPLLVTAVLAMTMGLCPMASHAGEAYGEELTGSLGAITGKSGVFTAAEISVASGEVDIASATVLKDWGLSIADPADAFYELRLGDNVLVAGEDYEIAGYYLATDTSEGPVTGGIVNAPEHDGNWTIVIEGKGSYGGTKDVPFTLDTGHLIDCATVATDKQAYGYTGDTIRPTITVTASDGTVLREGIDYTIAYGQQESVDTGYYNGQVWAVEDSGYFGHHSFTYRIAGADLSAASVVTKAPKYTPHGTLNAYSGAAVYEWTGAAINPIDQVLDAGGTLLREGVDYRVYFTKNGSNAELQSCIDEGRYEAHVAGIGSYEGKTIIKFQVTKPEHDLANAKVSGIRRYYPYTGSTIWPMDEVTVELGGRVLKLNTDYFPWSWVYTSDSSMGWSPAGDAYVVPGTYATSIDAVGNYYGQYAFVNWDIVDGAAMPICVDLADAEVSLSQASFSYDGTAKTPAVTVKLDGGTLRQGEDYTTSFADNVNAGTATVVVTGKGDYTGSKNATFEIVPSSIAMASVVLSPVTFTYDGKAKTPAVTVMLGSKTLVSGTDYTVSYENNTDAGFATAAVTGKGNYIGEIEATFSIAIVPQESDGSDEIGVPGGSENPVSAGDSESSAPSGGSGAQGSGSASSEADASSVFGGSDDARGTGNLSAPNESGGSEYHAPSSESGSWDGSKVSSESSASMVAVVKTEPTRWSRLSGDIAMDTMVSIVREGFSETGGTVVVATFGGYWDALAAAGLAGLSGAPVLMTDGQSLSAQTQSELERLAPSKVFVCGGPAAVSDNACAQIAAVCGVEPLRIYGENAVATAAQIDLAAHAATGGKWSGEAFLCTSDGYWDALAAAPVAYALHMPIFLTEADGTLSEATLAAIRECGITKVHIAGGPAAVSASTESVLGDLAGQRFAGDFAVQTSEAIAAFGLSRGMTANNLGVATTSGYWDALAGAALCGKKGSVLVLVTDSDSSSIDGFVGQNSANEVSAYVFGGPAAVGDDVMAKLQSATAAY